MDNDATWIRATSDIMIRVLLGKEGNQLLLKDFINAVMKDRDFPMLTKVTLLNPINMREIFSGKESVLDVKAEDENGRIYNIEVQGEGNHGFIHSSLYSWAKNYSSQLKKGIEYETLAPIICINVLEFIMFKERAAFHSCYMIKDLDEDDKTLTDHLQIHYIELNKPELNTDAIPGDRLRKWIQYLRMEGEAEEDKMKILLKNDPVLSQAHEVFETFTADGKMRARFEARMKWERDNAQKMRDARNSGREEGIQAARGEDARKMKEKDIEPALISGITGLSLEEIEKL